MYADHVFMVHFVLFVSLAESFGKRFVLPDKHTTSDALVIIAIALKRPMTIVVSE
jgi:hypothetical protein